jgi:hypothetical protein
MNKEDAILLGARAVTVMIKNGVPTTEDKNRAIDHVEDIIVDYKRLYEENLTLKIKLAQLEVIAD